MTQSILTTSVFTNPWISLGVTFLLGFVLSIILAITYNLKEERVTRKKEVEYKPTRRDKLISLAIGIIMFCIIVMIIVLIIYLIGNQLNQAALASG